MIFFFFKIYYDWTCKIMDLLTLISDNRLDNFFGILEFRLYIFLLITVLVDPKQGPSVCSVQVVSFNS